MAAAAQNKPGKAGASIRTIWGLAKSPELSLNEDALYAIIERETGKDSMRQLTQGQIDKVCRALSGMKDGAKRTQKRTDEGGSPRTVKLRNKIYALTGELGWNDDNARINGFVKKMFKVDRIEWLTVPQCHIIIEALKKMVERKEETIETEASHTEGNQGPGRGKEEPPGAGRHPARQAPAQPQEVREGGSHRV